jgi:hypothetical protein
VAKISRVVGTTSQVLEIFIQDATSTTGAGKTGLAFNTAGLACFYKRSLGTASVSVTLANITTLGTFVSGGFKEVDSTNMPGVYEFDPPNAALAAGADSVVFIITGTGIAPLLLEIELTAVNNQDATRFGLAALPAGPMAIKKNQALAALMFAMVNSSGAPVTGLSITATRSIDGAAFAACANSAAEIGTTGVYSINLAAADLNGTSFMFRFDGGGSALIRYYPLIAQQ